MRKPTPTTAISLASENSSSGVGHTAEYIYPPKGASKIIAHGDDLVTIIKK